MYSSPPSEPQGRQHNFAHISEKMRSYPQWVGWQYEERSGKRTKVPFQSNNGALASVTNSLAWCTFNDAVASFERGNGDGIGFVLTKDDPFCFIDLDDTAGDERLLARQRQIVEACQSYAEYSPSGAGLHIITEATVEAGRKRDKIEVYSDQRYMTMTGNLYRDLPITNQQSFVAMLWHEMSPAQSSHDGGIDSPEREADAAIVERMFASKNGDKAKDLWAGNWQRHYGSQSEADFALVNIIGFYSHNQQQITRLFKSAPSYRDGRYDGRSNLIANMVARSSDRRPPPGDFSAITDQLRKVVERAKIAPNGLHADMHDGPLPIVSADDLVGKPVAARTWHVADMVPARTVTLLSGDGGTGKSLAALQLAVATVIGGRWAGAMVRQGGAYFLTAEDELDEVHRRLVDIARSEGVGLDRLAGLTVSPLAGRDALLAVPSARNGVLEPTVLFQAVRDHIEAVRPALAVLDTSADLYGGEEMNRAQVRQFIGYLSGLALHYDMAVVLLSHPSLTGINSGSGLSGSTAWNNSVRSRLYLTADKAKLSVRKLQMMKANYGAIGQEVILEWRNGVFVVIGRTSNDAAHRAVAEHTADGLFLHLLAKTTAQGRTVSAHPSSRTNAALVFASAPEGKGFERSGFEAAMNRLFDQGRIRVETVGPPSKRKEIIVAVEGSEGFRPPSEPVPTGSDPHADIPSDPHSDLFRPPAFSPPIPPEGQGGPLGAGPPAQ